MKSQILFFFLLVSSFTILNSQPSGWIENTINPVPPRLNCVSSFVCVYYQQYRSGWIGGNNGTIFYTSNNGTNWIYRTSSLVGSNNVNSIASVNDSTALLAFNNSSTTYILRTTNRGVTWQTVYQQTNGFIRAIRFYYQSMPCIDIVTTGYAIGDPVGGRWTLLKTTNAGVSFDSAGLFIAQSGNETGLNNSLEFWGFSHVMFGTNNNRIYRSSNFGSNWAGVGMPYQSISSIEMTSGYVHSGGSQTAKSTNNGLNWQLVTLPGSGNCVFNSTESWYGRGSEIYRSTNDGQNWILNYASPNGGNYTDISVRKSVFEGGIMSGWAVKDNGTVSFYFASMAGIEKISSEIPQKFALSQNHPNPFNPTTKIRFDITSNVKSESSNIKLIVYDILGREVQTLVNEQLSPGTYEVEFDGSDYPTGVYYYQLTVNSEQLTKQFSDTKKMLLIK